jgi:S-adenosylhomocysteine hydrolase
MSHVFPNLPVLDELSHYCPKQSKQILSQTVLVCVQHILLTTGSLFEALIELGAKPSNIFVLGKCYSTNTEVLNNLHDIGINIIEGGQPTAYGTYSYIMDEEIRNLWSIVKAKKESLPSDGLIIIDDGGGCIRSLPKWASDYWPVIGGIEQTTNGLIKPIGLFKQPLIEVASSLAKRLIESPMIATAISDHICKTASVMEVTKYGIVGYGSIGKAVSRALHQEGYEVSIYDKNRLKIPDYLLKKSDVRDLLNDSQFILGCTGVDVIPEPEILGDIPGIKILASCSSGDYEFNKLLKYKQDYATRDGELIDTLSDIQIEYPEKIGSKMTILRGGFPINFDGVKESEPAVDIQLTRGLLLGAVIQTTLYFANPSLLTKNKNRKMLDPYIQRKVVNTWQKTASFEAEYSANFTDIEWIKNNSGGIYDDIGVNNYR